MIVIGQSNHAPVYNVAAVQAYLARLPGAWVGRTVRVRGMVLVWGCDALTGVGGQACRDWSPYLLERDGASLLPVAEGRPDPLLAALRRLPLVGQLVPAPYRVRLRAAPTLVCGTPPCYEALLLDAAPRAEQEGQEMKRPVALLGGPLALLLRGVASGSSTSGPAGGP